MLVRRSVLTAVCVNTRSHAKSMEIVWLQVKSLQYMRQGLFGLAIPPIAVCQDHQSHFVARVAI